LRAGVDDPLTKAQGVRMDIYSVGEVQSTTDERSNPLYGFNIVGIHGRPLVNFGYETRAEAEASRSDMLMAIETAKVITPMP
jgi:hypothetical protein